MYVVFLRPFISPKNVFSKGWEMERHCEAERKGSNGPCECFPK